MLNRITSHLPALAEADSVLDNEESGIALFPAPALCSRFERVRKENVVRARPPERQATLPPNPRTPYGFD